MGTGRLLLCTFVVVVVFCGERPHERRMLGIVGVFIFLPLFELRLQDWIWRRCFGGN